jgi:outer membrane receptor protein involved in Fe transport
VLGTTAIAGFVAPAHAQEADALEEVKVTGSRILRRDLDATSPLVTVGSEAFEGTGTVAIETSLNKLPQFVPAVTQFVTTDVQNTATNTAGASTLNLRGLGANRTLVLLDGRRAMPVNATLVVDINSIPAAAIKRVEVISGGASSAYGADAVGGVVNFILKNDFEGMEFDAQYGITEVGDDQELRVSTLMGGNFSDNRGNAMFGLEYYKRGDASFAERDFYTKGWADPNVPGTEAFWSDAYYSPGANTPNPTVVNGIFSQAAANSVSVANNFFFNKDATASLYTQADADGTYRYNGILDNRYRKKVTSGNLAQNQLNSLVSTPADRYSLFGRADYDITDSISLFVQGNFTKTSTRSILQFSPAVSQWGVSVPRDAAHPVSPELAALLDSRANQNANWNFNRVLDYLGPRGSSNDAQTYQVLAGLSGALPFGDWTWETYVSHGNTQTTNRLTGFASNARYRALILAPNYGAGARITSNQAPPGNGTSGATITCTSGLPVFTDFVPSQDCIDAITANMQNVQNMDQNIVEANLQGGLFNLPAGEVRGAAGADWRENTFSYQIDNLASAQGFNDNVIGLFPASSTKGDDAVKEAYAELLVPVLADLPAVKRMNLELGFRFSDYDSAGSINTYKALVDWAIVDAVRFRGGYQRANRAPNIGERFLPASQVVTTSGFGDPCGVNTPAAYGANTLTNPNAAQARAFCAQLMGAAGAAAYYATQVPGTGFFQFVTTTNSGSQNLQSEEADTITAGFVFRPSFEAAALSRFTASVDAYSIEIKNAIASLSFDAIYNQCLNPANNPTQTLTGNPFCAAITRDPITGNPAQTLSTFRNVGTFKTQGVDLNLDWGSDLNAMGLGSVPGAVSVNLAVTYLDKFEAQDVQGAPVLDYSGSAGGINGQSQGQFRFKTFTTIGYSVSGISANLRWRHLPSANSAASVQNPATLISGPHHYDVIDLTGNWELSQNYQVRFGVENLLDTDPEITAVNNATGAGFNSGQGITLPGYYDPLGRRYFLGFKARF